MTPREIRSRACGAIAFALAIAAPSWATDWYIDRSVCPTRPGTGTQLDPYCMIAWAVVAANDGDRIFIAPGVYPESLVINKSLELIGTGGSGATWLDLNFASAPILDVTTPRPVRLQGLTLSRADTIVPRGSVSRGGGIHCMNADLSCSDVVFQNCRVNWSISGSIHGEGGGIKATNSRIDLSRCRFVNCGAPFGGGIWATASTVVIQGCEMSSLGALVGGGIFADNSSVTVRDTSFYRNHTTTWDPHGASNAGSIFTSGGTLVVERSTFRENRCVSTPYTPSRGGAILAGGTVHIRDSLFVRNDADVGSAIDGGGSVGTVENCTFVEHLASYYHAPISSVLQGPLAIENCILWRNPMGLQPGLNITYSDVERGYPGLGNLNLDPRFRNASAGDYALQSTSPCIDAGDPSDLPPTFDLASAPRLLDGDLDGTMRVDMGCYELGHVALSVTGTPAPGGALSMANTGRSGMPFFRLLGTGFSATIVPPLGTLFVDPLAPLWADFRVGTIPDSVAVPIPLSVPVPLLVIFQDVAVDLAAQAGNVSNPVSVVIR